jgi:hypothetical protein
MSNNAAERELRAVAVGRRNWTFAGSDERGRRAAARSFADTSLPGPQVVRELGVIIAWPGRPAMCAANNGPELTGTTWRPENWRLTRLDQAA